MYDDPVLSEEIIRRILRTLESQTFADFYVKEFEDYITGDLEHKLNITRAESRELIKKKLQKLF